MTYTYRFKSKNTNFYLISTGQDKKGQVVKTVNGKDSVPENSILTVTGVITGDVVEAIITGVNNLYVSLQDDAENTRLTWSDKEYKWIIRATQQGTSYVNPADSADLYWFDEFGIGAVVIVKAERHIHPPQNEWVVTNA